MERKEYDMIERYLDGTLDEASARELEAMATDDPELALELEAERTIRTTLARDVASIPPVSTEPSGLLVARLAATSGASGGAAGTSGGVLGTIFGTGTGLGVVTIVGLIGLTVGAIFFAENVDETEPLGSPFEQISPSGLSFPEFDRTDDRDDDREESRVDRNDVRAPLPSPSQRSVGTSPSTPPRSERRRPATNDVEAAAVDAVSEQPTTPASPHQPPPTAEEQAQQMLRRLDAEQTRDDPIPQVDGPSSTMEVRVEN